MRRIGPGVWAGEMGVERSLTKRGTVGNLEKQRAPQIYTIRPCTKLPHLPRLTNGYLSRFRKTLTSTFYNLCG